MNVRALANRQFLRKFLIIGIVCILFSLWALYDAMVGFPKKKLYPARAYEELVQRGLDDKELNAQWLELAEKNGWSLAKPKSVKEAESAIQLNYGMMVIALAAGIPMLIWYFQTLSAWVETTPNGLTSSWKQTLDFSSATQLDKQKWYDKGIAKLYYEESGKRRLFVLDDFKFNRPEMAEIMKWVELHVDAEKIVNDNPPAPKNEKQTAVADDNDGDVIEE